ncbi:MAG: methyltransferase domain-containing protein [Candidatus Jordarchaeaceae archaeon]
MCNVAVLEFFVEACRLEEFEGKRILEVGSKYVNGSVRPLVEKFLSPREYVGVDVELGRYVDVVLPAEKLLEYFGEKSFDVIISTELLEHVRDWRLVINNMKKILNLNGHIYITTRSYGFHYHCHPYDFWRYELDDMRSIFSDFKIECLKRDHEAPGVFLKAAKPPKWIPNDLSNITLYSMILGRRTKSIPDLSEMPLSRKLELKLLNKGSNWLKWLLTKSSK